LKQYKKIPSLSWGYAPGSYYRKRYYKNALGSLVLGGYDKSRFVGEPLSFKFYPDTGRELVVAVRNIRKQAETSTGESLLRGSILAALDSSHPNLWLPEEDCRLFESAFGLLWNETAMMYFINDTAHSRLLEDNPTVVLTLADDMLATNTIDIHIPYGSFDLTADYPLVSGPRKYFPLKRAANDSQVGPNLVLISSVNAYWQYTIGRAFLQEMYIITDYERQNFSIAQAEWGTASTASDIVEIAAVVAPRDNGRTKKIVGITVGVTLVIVAIASASVMFSRRRTSRQQEVILEKSTRECPVEIPSGEMFEADEPVTSPKELDSCERRVELEAPDYPVELPAHSERSKDWY
jgi:hypothetical protein